jgi:23S rRNA (pseudouridine1915-N3)-methyltransferase
MKIKIIAIGKEKSKHLLRLMDDYIERLPWKLEIVELEPSESSSPAKVKEDETKRLLEKAGKVSAIIVLEERGEMLSSTEFAGRLEKLMVNGISNVAFIIGGAYGLDQKMIAPLKDKLSLGRMVLPHKLARLILVEQIYRAYAILDGHPYHK